MGSAVALKRTKDQGVVPSRAEFRELLERVVQDVDSDERIGSLLRAAAIRLRFHYPDVDMTVNVAASDEPGRHLKWTFTDVDWQPKLELEMDSEVANSYLQGTESLAVAIARRRVRVRGDSKVTLLYLPALRLV